MAKYFMNRLIYSHEPEACENIAWRVKYLAILDIFTAVVSIRTGNSHLRVDCRNCSNPVE